MSDIFNIKWAERMKTDPMANSILNNKIKYQSFDTYKYWYSENDDRVFYDGTTRTGFKRRMNQLYSDRYVKRRPASNRWNLGYYRRGNHVITTEDNENKYWENTTPQSVFNHTSIAHAENPKIESLKNIQVYQKTI